jgi:hypothetical protein
LADGVPLSLYLGLQDGQLANLESASRIALAWNNLVLETFAIIDPSADVRIQLLDAVESSLGFRSIIRATSKVAKQHPIIAGALGAVVGNFLMTPVQDISHDVWEKIYEAAGFAPGEAKKCAVEDPDKVKEQASKAQHAAFAAPQKRELFLQLDREPVITSVGPMPSIMLGDKPPPALIVPRSDFAPRAGVVVVSQETSEKKTTSERLPVILLTPKLKAKELMWEFADETGRPFSAKMKDPDFISALEQGRTGAELKIGLKMEIEVETKLETVDGLWIVKSRDVTKVYSPRLPAAPDLFGDHRGENGS